MEGFQKKIHRPRGSKDTLIRITVKGDFIGLSGHALFDEEGRDIVCAAVSALTLCSAQIWSKRDDVVCSSLEKGEFSFRFKWNENNGDLKVQFEFLKQQYKIISQHYPDHVNYSEF